MNKKMPFLILLAFTLSAYTQTKHEFKPEIKICGTVFTGWEFNIDDAEFISKIDTSQPNSNSPFGYNPVKNQFEKSKNSFYLERSYINVMAFLTREIKAKLTTDLNPFTDGSGKTQYGLHIKFAHVYYTPFIHDDGMSLSFGFGLISNNWVSSNDKYWGFRGFAKTLTDYQWITTATRSGVNINKTTSSFFPTADLGLDVVFNLPGDFGEINAEVLQGNGFRNLQFDTRFKDLLFTAFVHPMAGIINKRIEFAKKKGRDRIDGISDLTLGGYAYIGKLDKGENYTPNGVQYVRNRFGGMVHVKYNFKKIGFVRIGGEIGMQSNQDPSGIKPDSVSETNSFGYSGYLEFCPPVEQLKEKLSLVARLDIYDPNTDNSNSSEITFNDNTDKQMLLILGLAFKPAKVLTIGLTYHSLIYQKDFVVKYDGSLTKSDGKLMFQMILNF